MTAQKSSVKLPAGDAMPAASEYIRILQEPIGYRCQRVIGLRPGRRPAPPPSASANPSIPRTARPWRRASSRPAPRKATQTKRKLLNGLNRCPHPKDNGLDDVDPVGLCAARQAYFIHTIPDLKHTIPWHFSNMAVGQLQLQEEERSATCRL